MSTAGKVLSVLVTLMVLVSIYLLSMVSALNRGWGSRIDSVEAEIVAANDQVLEARREAVAIEARIDAERLSTDAKLRSLRIVMDQLQGRLSALEEDRLRLQLRLDDERELHEKMEATVADRRADAERLQASLSESDAKVDRLAAENAEKLDRLATLRDQFTSLVEENGTLLRQAASAGQSSRLRSRSVPVASAE